MFAGIHINENLHEKYYRIEEISLYYGNIISSIFYNARNLNMGISIGISLEIEFKEGTKIRIHNTHTLNDWKTSDALHSLIGSRLAKIKHYGGMPWQIDEELLVETSLLEIVSETGRISFLIPLRPGETEDQGQPAAVVFYKIDPFPNVIGCTILSAELSDDQLMLSLDSGFTIAVFDGAQGIVELRYMRTGDDLTSLIGHKLLRIEAKIEPIITEPDCSNQHETCILVVTTDHSFVTLVSHNENDDPEYESGFAIQVRTVSTPDKSSYGRGISCDDFVEIVHLAEFILWRGNGRPVPFSELRRRSTWPGTIEHLHKSLATLVEGGVLVKSESGYVLSQQTKERLPNLVAKAFEGWGEGHWVYDWWKSKYGGHEWWNLFENS